MRVRLVRKVGFSSGHRYWLRGLDEQGNRSLFGRWASPHNHGHNYVLEAGFEGQVDPTTGMVVNIKTLDAMLDDCIVAKFDQKSINDEVPSFANRPPTLEHLLLHFRDVILAELNDGVHLVQLRLVETPELWGEWSNQDGSETMTLTRTYEFAASHRLYAEGLSAERNLELYGKCANPSGHGHNYKLEVTVSGDLDERTGMMVDLMALDAAVNERVVERYDHHHLNSDLPEFQGKITTSEVVAAEIWRALDGQIPAKLERVRLFETDRSWFEITS
ncbi:MAG: 6-carboxytetrahydropterin synthase [Armatimonadetes bacterium]|nr:6-carboxytetrahydropterin synthase [Armatimonadota bacterium]